MAEKKITKKDMFTKLLEVVKGDAEMTAFIEHEMELLDRKKDKTKPTKTQEQNLQLMDALYAELVAVGKAVTISELQKVGETAGALSNQKVSALFRLMDGEKVEKSTVKGKSYFKAIV